MRRLNFFCLVLPLLLINCACAQSGKVGNPKVVTVKAPLTEFMAGYLRLRRLFDTATNRNIVADMPSIDVYNPAGISIYHGTGSAKNATFLRSIVPGSLQNNPSKKVDARPTLEESMSLVPELKPYRTSFLNTKSRYTIFAVTYPVKGCKEQNEAVQELEKHAATFGIRIVEIQLNQKA